MTKNLKSIKIVLIIAQICLILPILGFILTPLVSLANQDEIDQLNSEIAEKQQKIHELDREIARQKEALNSVSGKANNLQGTIASLEATKKKIENDINKTETEISRAELTIQRLALEIGEKESLIQKNSEGLSESIRRINSLENISTIEKFLGYETISDFWIDFELTEKLQKKMHTEIQELLALNNELKEKENEKLSERNNLTQHKKELSGEKEVALITKKEKQTLLNQTKNEEAEYQRILNQKISEKKKFEEELLEIESQLHYLIDPDSFPNAKKGILGWPLDSIRITQRFGGTSFAKNNPQIYGRTYHPGVDFGTPIGTKVKSVDGGVVKGFGNTDAFPGCYAWGRWILIEHDNGLSSLYAHLSSILVSQGERVSRGQVIALSGNSGISTGPHLHLSVYASQGVKIGRYGDFKSGTGCSATNATGPFADLEAYLDPESYLPSSY